HARMALRVASGTQRDDELGPQARLRADRERAFDRGASRADVPQPLAGAVVVFLEAAAVVSHRDHAPAVAVADHDLGAPRARVLAHVREPFLDDPEDLDLP